jgi:hypothetical protein
MTIHIVALDKAPIPICQLLPRTAREMLVNAASTPNLTSRADAITIATNMIRNA